MSDKKIKTKRDVKAITDFDIGEKRYKEGDIIRGVSDKLYEAIKTSVVPIRKKK